MSYTHERSIAMPALHFSYSDDLTELEAAALDYLIRTLQPGFCPSREEISQAVGLGRRGYHITKLLDSLVEKSYIRMEPGRFRAITVLRRPDGRRFSLDTFWAPLVGQIVASKPLPSVGQLDNPFAGEAVELTRSLVRGRDDVFALRVSGDSMIDALVNDGDLVILSAAQEVYNGDMVAARVTGDDGQEATTLKHFYRENGHVRLQPANPAMLPLYYPPSQVHVYGKVVLVIRQVG
jgi:repressor LexA